jgi:hypothetical protein
MQLLLHLQALRLRFSPDRRAVAAAEAATRNGRRFEVRARAFVLAAGGIETARLLLLSAGEAGGPANPHGVVGRYFMEHGYDSGRVFVPRDPRRRCGSTMPCACLPVAEDSLRAAPSRRARRR